MLRNKKHFHSSQDSCWIGWTPRKTFSVKLNTVVKQPNAKHRTENIIPNIFFFKLENSDSENFMNKIPSTNTKWGYWKVMKDDVHVTATSMLLMSVLPGKMRDKNDINPPTTTAILSMSVKSSDRSREAANHKKVTRKRTLNSFDPSVASKSFFVQLSINEYVNCLMRK